MLKICKVDGCSRSDRMALGLCSMHYQRLMRTGGTDLLSLVPKICSVPECGKKHYGKGFCQNHYRKHAGWHKWNAEKWKREALPHEKKCSVKGCKLIMYAKGYCRNHYGDFKRNGSQLYVNPKKLGLFCEICGRAGRHKYDEHVLCSHHKKMYDKYGSIVLTDPVYHFRGKNNPRWNGGKSDYPNHAEFKRNRLIKLSQVNYTCEVCGDYTNKCHHKDASRDNHSVDNLQALCRKHHGEAHRRERANKPMKVKTSKYIRDYGATINVLATQLKMSVSTVISYHKQGILSSFLPSSFPSTGSPS